MPCVSGSKYVVDTVTTGNLNFLDDNDNNQDSHTIGS